MIIKPSYKKQVTKQEEKAPVVVVKEPEVVKVPSYKIVEKEIIFEEDEEEDIDE